MFRETISSVMNSALKVIHQWALSANLKVNDGKADMVIFTRRYKIPAWKPTRLNRKELTIRDHTQVILESKLTCKLNVADKVKKARGALYACKQMQGSTRGLSPVLMHWCYTAVVQPILLYDALARCTAPSKISYRKLLERV